MRTLNILLAAALVTAAPLAAQTTALATGNGARATVRVETTLAIPAFLQARETVALAQTHQGNGFTEYLATYTVRGNVRWTLDAQAIPAGVTVLDENGNWTPEPATIGLGTPTNGTTILVRVRVTDTAAANWQQNLAINAQRTF
jgi:hypothetical protein